jgi:hypothetical protein
MGRATRKYGQSNNFAGQKLRMGFDRDKALSVFSNGGGLSLGELLRCKVRYFADGAILGTEAFIESWFQQNRDKVGAKRPNGARQMQGGGWGPLRVLRDLRRAPVE